MIARPGDTASIDPRRFAEPARELLETLRRSRITVMGLGRFGGALGLIRFLAALGAEITVTDKAPEEDLAQSVAAIADLPNVARRLGGHREEDFTACDFLFVNPAVTPGNELVARARARGARAATEIGLFLARCTSAVCAVTGTSGKSTTSAFAAAMLEASGARCFFGGNVGISLLAQAADITAESKVVLELSSFQLYHLGAGWLPYRPPRFAALVNVYSDHLNWHGTQAEYARAKRAIFSPRDGDPWAIAPGDDGLVLPWALASGRRLLAIGSSPDQAACSVSGSDEVVLCRDGRRETLFARADVRLPGVINLRNASFAAGLAWCAGATNAGILHAVRSFDGLPHRLERMAVIDGITFVNSSVATTPIEAARTLDAIEGASVLMAGGAKEKELPFYPLAHAARRATRAAVFFGQTAAQLAAEFKREAPSVRTMQVEDFGDAFRAAYAEARPGDTVILAPGCPSFDGFLNFQARGDAFKQAVAALRPA